MPALATDGQRSLCVADHRQSLANSALRLHDRKESIPHLSMRMRGPERRASGPRRDGCAQCPGGRWTGLLVPGSRPLTTVVGRPRRPSAWHAGATPTALQADGLPSATRSVSEVQSQQPGNFLPVRPGPCARFAARVPGEPLSPRARAPSHPAGCVRPALRRASSEPTPEANPCAAPCAKPSDASCTTTPRGEAGEPPRRAAYSAPPPQGSAADTAR